MTPDENQSAGQPTCGHCGKPMRFNVPRMGPDGGYVHADTGRLMCDDSGPESQPNLEGGDSPARSNSDQLPVMPVPTSNPSAPAAGQPDEARVEQRHCELNETLFSLHQRDIRSIEYERKLLANSEARAVAEAVEKCQNPSADIIEVAVSLATAELRAQMEAAKLECKSRKEEAESWKAAWVAKDERYASVLVQLAKAEAALGVARAEFGKI